MNLPWDAIWHTAVGIGYIVFATWATGHALLNKRDPRAAFGWIGLCWLMPFAGAAIYSVFGINRVEARGRRLQGLSQRRPRELPGHFDDLPLIQLQRIGGAVSGLPLLGGNRLQPLRDASHAYPQMLEAIAAARQTIWLESYIFDTSGPSRRFFEALVAAVKRGVVVKVLIDGFGEWYSLPHPVARLRRRGIDAARFLPPRLLPPSLSVNLRNHRKTLIVDGLVGFTGGMNISNVYLARRRRKRTADTHFRVDGPVVVQLAAAFARDWAFATREKLPLAVPPERVGNARARVIGGGPDEDLDKLVLVLLGAVSAAHRSIHIMTPYFLPPRELAAALQAAALRGVDVEVILPYHSNLRYVDWAARHAMRYLLEYGVRIYFSPKPFDHSKLLMVDGVYSLVGSANLDPRSLRLNFELGVEVFDPGLCAQLETVFEQARARSNPVDPIAHNLRALPVRLRDSVFWLFSPYL
ncbi:MAG TPA: phospholipase D-like domain-containing protein [Nevskiaceae bacterium]|nr:phospholipase D-like domain-containing protein [Nevskiaceae bacterium]